MVAVAACRELPPLKAESRHAAEFFRKIIVSPAGALAAAAAAYQHDRLHFGGDASGWRGGGRDAFCECQEVKLCHGGCR